ncbi:FecCD family ABC transporter permease [Paenibacillus alkalitolerans]|uniref:FecCD family ABC transporter permease n=1 Tax=Paenibacillus alkalitolerans TaxID=2799335 RepID=UPI0018F46FA8|nr:iron ABC transporter permease [Paenibacillus alkalitolerans]
MKIEAGRNAIGGRSFLPPILLLVGFLFIAAGLQVVAGSPAVSWRELPGIVFWDEGGELQRTVVMEIRMPRVALGFLVGAMLGAAGTLMQGAMNNALAGPELLGVSAGASLALAVITVLHLPVSVQLHPLFALWGGLVGGCCVVLAARGSRGALGMLLIGMSVSAIMNGLLVLLISLGTSNDVNMLYLYLLGSLANRNWDHVLRIMPWFLATLPVCLFFTRTINLLQLGDDTAAGLGVKVGRSRVAIFALCAILVAVTVSQSGPIGYIALLAPHIIRTLLRMADARIVLPLAMLCGGVLLVTADMAARLLLYPIEIPVGIWTTLLGGSCFLFLLLRRQGGGFHG